MRFSIHTGEGERLCERGSDMRSASRMQRARAGAKSASQFCYLRLSGMARNMSLRLSGMRAKFAGRRTDAWAQYA